MKTVIIINGKGGSGKDTLIDGYREYTKTTRPFGFLNESSITPVKQMVQWNGMWDGKDKSNKARKMLSDIKFALDEYNDFSTIYILKLIDRLKLMDCTNLMFVHVREPKQIENLVNKVKLMDNIKIHTLLIRSKRTDDLVYGDAADDETEFYDYDFIFRNDDDIETSVKNFSEMINQIVEQDTEEKH